MRCIAFLFASIACGGHAQVHTGIGCHEVCSVMGLGWGGGWRIACTRPFCSGCPQCPYTGPTPPPFDLNSTRNYGKCMWGNRGKPTCERTIDVSIPTSDDLSRDQRRLLHGFVGCGAFSGQEDKCTDAFYYASQDRTKRSYHPDPKARVRCVYGGRYGPTICKGAFAQPESCKGTPVPPRLGNTPTGLRYGVDFPEKCGPERGGPVCGRQIARTNFGVNICAKISLDRFDCLNAYVQSTDNPLHQQFAHYSEVPVRFPCIALNVMNYGADFVCMPDFTTKMSCTGPTPPPPTMPPGPPGVDNYGRNCWHGCEETQGSCAWCGPSGMCCRLGYEGNGCNGQMGLNNFAHVCVGRTPITRTTLPPPTPSPTVSPSPSSTTPAPTPTLAPTPAATPAPPTPQLPWSTLYSTGTFGNVHTSKIEFNSRFHQARSGIARRECTSCWKSHRDIYFRRKTQPQLYDAWEGLMVTWSDVNFHIDFDIYSTLEDALADQNAWQFCNGNDPNIGFPRDCGPTSRSKNQFTSFTSRRGQKNYKWSIQLHADTTSTTTTSIASSAATSIESGDTVFLSTLSGRGNMIDIEGAAVRSRWVSRGNWQAITLEKTKGGDINSGDVVYLKTHTGAYIDVLGQMVQARWNDQGDWQAMVIEKRIGSGPIHSDDVICFLSVHSNSHIHVEGDNVRARWNDCGDWQAMRIEKEETMALFSGSSIHLLAHTANRIAVEGVSVHARWSEAGLWQTLTIESQGGRAIWSGDVVFLKAHTGRLLHVEDTTVLAKWNDYGKWQMFIVEKEDGNGPVMPGDTIWLRAHTGKYIEVDGVAVQARWSQTGQWQSFIVEEASEPESGPEPEFEPETTPELEPEQRRLTEASPKSWSNEQQGNSHVVLL